MQTAAQALKIQRRMLQCKTITNPAAAAAKAAAAVAAAEAPHLKMLRHSYSLAQLK
jgi:hypothetical protein